MYASEVIHGFVGIGNYHERPVQTETSGRAPWLKEFQRRHPVTGPGRAAIALAVTPVGA